MANFFSTYSNEKKLLAIIDNIHDFLKGTRVPGNLKADISRDVTRFAYQCLNGIGNIVLDNNTDNIMDYIEQLTNRKVSSISNIEEDTVEYYEQKYKADLRTNKRKKYTYNDLYNEITSTGNVDTFLLTELSDIDIIELVFDDGESFATFPISYQKKIGEFITKFYFPQRDPGIEVDINFTFDGGSGIMNKFLADFTQCKNLIIPQNISDSASTTIGHFNKSPTRIIYKFPTTQTDRYDSTSNVLTNGIFNINFTDNQFGAGKKNTAFDFNIEKISPNSLVSLNYDDNISQGPGVTYLANCMYYTGGTFPLPSTSSIMKIDNIYNTFNNRNNNSDEYKKLLLDIKRGGDWDPSDCCNKLTGLQIILGSIDRLCCTKTRLEKVNCAYINGEDIILYRFPTNQHALLNIISSHINAIEDAIDSLNELPILDHNFTDLETLSRCTPSVEKKFRFKSDTIGVSSYIGNLILDKICNYISQIKKLYADYNEITIVNITEATKGNDLSSINELILSLFFMKNALKYIVPYVKDNLDSNISTTPTPILFKFEEKDYSITINNEDVIIIDQSQQQVNLTSLITETNTKIATNEEISKISKILNIRYDENRKIKPWGQLVTPDNFFAKTIESKNHYPNSYDYDSLEKIDKGIKTIVSYKTARGSDGVNGVRPSRTAQTTNYANNVIMVNFFFAALKIQGILFTDPATDYSTNPIFNMLTQFSIFYLNTTTPIDLNLYATELGYYNDMYMTRCQDSIRNSNIPQPIRGGSIDNYEIQSGGALQDHAFNVSIRQINWYIINSMPLFELDIIDNNSKLNTRYINEILCNVDIMLEELIIFNLGGDERFLYSLDSINELKYIINIIISEFSKYVYLPKQPRGLPEFNVTILNEIVASYTNLDVELKKVMTVAPLSSESVNYTNSPLFFILFNNYLLRNEILQNGYGFKDLYFSFVPRFMNRQFYQYQFDIDRNEGEFISVAFLDNFIGYFSDIYDKQYQYQEQLVSPTRISDNNTGYHDSGDESGDESGYDSGYDKYGNRNIQYSPPNSQMSDNSDNEDDPSKSPRWNFLPAVQNLFSPNKFKKGIDARAKRAEGATQRQRDKKDEILAERRGQNPIGYVPNYGGTRKNKRKQHKKYKSYNRKNKNKNKNKTNRKSKKHNKSKNNRKPNKTQRKHR